MRNPKSEALIPKENRNPKCQWDARRSDSPPFRASGFFRHLAFVIRVSVLRHPLIPGARLLTSPGRFQSGIRIRLPSRVIQEMRERGEERFHVCLA